MTQQEIAALAEILRRIPVSTAEALWLDALLKRLTAASVTQITPS